MATLSDLTEILSKVTGLPEATVFAYGRFARQDGLISQAGRGSGGASMSFEDAANLLIAVCGTAVTRESGDAIKAFRPARGMLTPPDPPFDVAFNKWAKQFGLRKWEPTSDTNLSFGKFLEMMIEMAGNGALDGLLRQIPTVEFSADYIARDDIEPDEQFDPRKALEKGHLSLKPPQEIEIGIDVSVNLSFIRSHSRVDLSFRHLWGDEEEYASFNFWVSKARRAASGLFGGARDLRILASVTESTLIALGRTVLGETVPAQLLRESNAAKRLSRIANSLQEEGGS